jgi:hypothetical protein
MKDIFKMECLCSQIGNTYKNSEKSWKMLIKLQREIFYEVNLIFLPVFILKINCMMEL